MRSEIDQDGESIDGSRGFTTTPAGFDDTGDTMTRTLVRWLRGNAEVALALLVSATCGLLAVFEVRGVTQETVNSAILLVLGLLAATLLRDRRIAERTVAGEAAVRVLSGTEVGRALSDCQRVTDQWLFKGGTGTYLRAVTLRACVDHARRDRRPLRIQVEIIDPTNDELCAEYARFRQSLSPGQDGTGESWTTLRTRKESYATILALCWHQQRFSPLSATVGLSSVMSTFRWDMSNQRLVMTQENPSGPALAFDQGTPFYRAYNGELDASFRQTRQIKLDRARDIPLSDEPSVEEVRRLFTALNVELPHTFGPKEIADIVKRALHAKNPYR